MALQEPVYVSHRQWFYLGVFLFVFAIACFGMFVFLDSIPKVPSNLSPTNIAFISAIELILLIPGVIVLRFFFKSRRIEFYEDFAKVFLTWNNDSREIPYSRLELGRLKMGMRGAGFVFDFMLSVKGEGKSSSWDVRSVRIRKLNTTLYSWLRQKTAA
jgi:hypothetical protein